MFILEVSDGPMLVDYASYVVIASKLLPEDIMNARVQILNLMSIPIIW